jgi:NDP-sugar pyrophosphorylase family protein
MPSLFEKMRDISLKTIAYPLHEEWLDVGLPGDLRKAQSEKFSSRGSKL